MELGKSILKNNCWYKSLDELVAAVKKDFWEGGLNCTVSFSLSR